MKLELYRETALTTRGRAYGEEYTFDKTEKGGWIGFEELWNPLVQETFGNHPDSVEWGAFKASKDLYRKEFCKFMEAEIERLHINSTSHRMLRVVFGTFCLNLLKEKYIDIADGLYDDGVFLLVERELSKGEINGFYWLGNLGIYGEEEPVRTPDKPKFVKLVGITIDSRVFEVENVIHHEVNEQYGSLHYVCSEGGKKREGYVKYSELNIIQP